MCKYVRLTTKEAEWEALTLSPASPPLLQFQPDLSLFTVDFVGLRMNKANYSALLNKIQVMFTQSSTITDYFSTADFIMAFSAYQKSAITVLDDGSKVSMFTVCFACVDELMKLHVPTPPLSFHSPSLAGSGSNTYN